MVPSLIHCQTLTGGYIKILTFIVKIGTDVD